MKRRTVAVLGLLLAAAAAPGADPGRRHLLPPAIAYPEGIAHDPRTGALYVAGSADGTIARIDPRGGAAVVPAPEVKAQLGTAFPGILGLRLDRQGRLWMAGGRTGKVLVTDPRSGRLIATVTPPEAEKGLINDIAFAGGRAFFTDTLRPILWSVDLSAPLPSTPEPWLAFEGTPLRYAQGANLNGIAATRDGRALIAVQMNKGLLFRIDVATRAIAPLDLGGETLEGADGLVLHGRTLYVVRQTVGEIVTVALSRDLARGRVVARTAVPGLLWPSTAVIVGGDLIVVNCQFNRRKGNDPEQPFTLQRVPLASLAG